VFNGLKKTGWSQTGFSKWDNDNTWDVIDKVEQIATSINATMAQVSLRWCMQKPFITSTIMGARTLQQLEDNLTAARISLSAEQMQELDEVSKLNLPYPYDLLGQRKQQYLKKKLQL